VLEDVAVVHVAAGVALEAHGEFEELVGVCSRSTPRAACERVITPPRLGTNRAFLGSG
jgi:hypothetical protein